MLVINSDSKTIFKATFIIYLCYLNLKSSAAAAGIQALDPQQAALNLNDQLKVYENCKVHGMLAQLVDINFEPANLHRIVPLNVPIMYSVVKYIAVPWGNMQCNDKTRYRLISDGFLIKAMPFSKINCLAEIYMGPIQCQKWTLVDDPIEIEDILPESFKHIRVPHFMAGTQPC